MAKFLWACWDGGGNLPPGLGIARVLVERGHSVVFAGRGAMLHRVRAAGLGAHELTHAYALIDRFAWHPLATIFGYLGSPAVEEELADVVRAQSPDVVIVDAMFSAALAAAPGFARPIAVAVHTFCSRIYAIWKSNFERQSAARVRAGFGALPCLDELWGSCDVVQVNTLAAFDGPGRDPLPNVRHGAPVFYEEPHALSGALPWSADDPTPIVLVSFSTVFEQRSPTMLQRALDALRALPVNIVATTGGIVAPGALRAPTNAVVHRFASHEALLSRASLVVTHGGHGTTMRSLRHGVPVVCIPALADDQPAIAAAIRDWGAGISLPRDANVADIRRAAQLVIGNADYRASAARLGAPLAASDGANAAADVFEQLAATRTGTAASSHPPRGHGRFT